MSLCLFRSLQAVTERYEYVENSRLVDARLCMSTVAVGLAALALLWDWLHPYPLSRPVLIFCVLSYFVLMTVLQLYAWFVEKGIFFIATDADPTGNTPDKVWRFSSTLKRYGTKRNAIK